MAKVDRSVEDGFGEARNAFRVVWAPGSIRAEEEWERVIRGADLTKGSSTGGTGTAESGDVEKSILSSSDVGDRSNTVSCIGVSCIGVGELSLSSSISA